jgi:HSP20 family protein
MSVDRFNFPQMFFVAETRHTDDIWQPRADVYRMADGWLVKLELAGVRSDEIRLVAEGTTLIVEGTRRDQHCCLCVGCHCMEIAYSRFQRIVELPELARDADISTSYVDGMLIVRIKMGGGL